jgi:uncharacterized cofD-like protein
MNTLGSSARSLLSDPRRRIVVVGGGTGSHSALLGLRDLAIDLTAVVSVMDSGGSSGRLRDEYGFLPPGDARQCLVALSGDEDTAAMLRALFTYRFRGHRGASVLETDRALDGHSLGNLFISALADITGSTESAYAWAGRLLGARGKVIPVTTSNVQLCARLTDATVVCGEAAIDVRTEHPEVELDYVYLDHPAYPTASAAAALRLADLVVLGPGDLFTSIIPNLLVDGITDALAAARYRVFVVNLMTKRGESDGYRASTFVHHLLEYLEPAHLDAVVVNTAAPPPRVLQRYASEGALPVEADIETIESMGITVLPGMVASSRYFMRHDPTALAHLLWDWLQAQTDDRLAQPERAA